MSASIFREILWYPKDWGVSLRNFPNIYRTPLLRISEGSLRHNLSRDKVQSHHETGRLSSYGMWRRVYTMYLPMCSSHNDPVSSSDYAGPNGKILNGWWLAGSVERNSSGETEEKHNKYLKMSFESRVIRSEIEKVTDSKKFLPWLRVVWSIPIRWNQLTPSSTLMMEQQVDI